MIEKGLARNVLTNVFPEECRAVGPNSLNDLLSQDVTIVAPDEGRPFPIMEIFEFPKGSGSIHSCCYSIYKILKDQFGRKPTLPEFKQAIAKDTKRGPLSDEQVEAILKKIKELD